MLQSDSISLLTTYMHELRSSALASKSILIYLTRKPK